MNRIGWLRAAVLGANDGIVSVGSLIAGIAAAGKPRADILLASVASLVAGAMSMAAGEYVSVQSQADSEEADLAVERRELRKNPERELEELVGIYRERGLDEALARQVAEQLTAHDALAVHARDEIGITEAMRARPVQAAAASAASFAAGGVLPIAALWLAPETSVAPSLAITTLAALVLLGAVSAWAGGAPMARAAVRVVLWGVGAMAVTALAGTLFGAVP